MTTVHNPGGLIAALPGCFGFTPVESLAVVVLEVDGALKCVLRVDLSDVVDSEVHLQQFAEQVDAVATHEAVAVWITDAADVWDRLEQLTQQFRWFLSVKLKDSYFTDNLVWRSESGRGGDVPASSPVSVAAVVEGRRQYGSRDEVTALLEPSALPMTAVQVEDGEDALSVSARNLLDGAMRDRLYARAVDEDAHLVESSLIEAARVLPGLYRAHALTAVAFFAYCRGDGVLAGEAVFQALQAGETTMAKLLDTALRNGVHPDAVRGLATAGVKQ